MFAKNGQKTGYLSSSGKVYFNSFSLHSGLFAFTIGKYIFAFIFLQPIELIDTFYAE